MDSNIGDQRTESGHVADSVNERRSNFSRQASFQRVISVRTFTAGVIGAVAVALVAHSRISAQDAQQWEREARAAVEQNIRAFNAHDRKGYWDAYNYPLISIDSDGRISTRASTHEDAEALIVRGQPDFAEVQKEGWDYSTLDAADAVDVSANKVHFRVVFTRHRKDHFAYRSVHAFWIVTRQDGHWGIQVQSTLADTASAR